MTKPSGDMASHLETILKSLPDKPGVYQYFDKESKIIYIGKAKSLKKRVSSYFNKDLSLTGKIRVLVSKITDIRVIIVETELDALLLENTLIKNYQPRYNVMLKDDKTYPWICIKNEPFPRIFPTRNIIKDGSEYFGPYASGKMMNNILELVRQLYPLRNCTLNLTENNIRKGRFKVCLEYHIGNCKGPCEGLQSAADYQQNITAIKEIIRGNISTVRQQLIGLMKALSVDFAYEKAQVVKEKIDLLDRYQSRSTVVNPAINNVDVFSFAEDSSAGYINFLKVVSGAIVQSHTIEMRRKLDESPEELMVLAITEIRLRFLSNASEVLIPFKVDMELPEVTFIVPQRGDKKKLLELSERNAKFYQMEKQRQKDLVDPERRSKRVLQTMMKDLRLTEPPVRIDCFDNSNIQGSYPVAAMVVFVNAKPDKKEYRHFNIRTVEGPDDYASMEEIIYRRYKRVLEEEQPLPQLIVVDGGKGQLSAALNSLEKLGLRGSVGIIGIAKRLEEIYYPEDPLPMYLDKKSETLKIIQQLRDEAHRFGITHHRKRREKGTIKTALTGIEGIGEATSQMLLQNFKSVKNIKKATLDELQEFIGKAKGKVVYDYYRKDDQ